MDEPGPRVATSVPFSERVTARFLMVTVIGLGLLVPLLLVGGVSGERQRYYQEALGDVALSFGQAQQIVGPLLVIPAQDRVLQTDATGTTQQQLVPTVHIVLPDALSVQIELSHSYRFRGIYPVPVYRAAVDLTGELPAIDRSKVERAHHQVFWDRAFLSIGLADPRAIREGHTLKLASQPLDLRPGSGLSWLGPGVRVPLDAQLQSQLAQPGLAQALGGGWQQRRDPAAPAFAGAPFELRLVLGGTGRFAVAPLGNQTAINMAASWPHPKFEGHFLPLSHEIGADGFTARWQVSALARGVPESFSLRQEGKGFAQVDAAVSLHEPVTDYTSVDRGLKYGALFIALTFLAVLCFELLTGSRLHLVQYGVVGLALVLFYLVLLALSEHWSFAWAYLAATGVIVLLLGGYGRSITGRSAMGWCFAGLQTALYAVLYVLLQLEDYALLTGVTVLVVGLAALMFVTRTLHIGERRLAAPAGAG